MLIGVFSDTHDNLVAIDRALVAFEQAGVEAVVHAGDFVAPFALKMILRRLDVPIYAVFGNNDGERTGLRRLLPELSDGPLRFVLGGRTIVLAHDPEALADEDTAGADIVITGHLHDSPRAETRDGTLYVDPGECCGWLTGKGRICLLDTEALGAEHRIVHEQERPE